jgi:hypothetical protein
MQEIKSQQLLLKAQVQPLDKEAALQLFSHCTGMDSEMLLPELQQLQDSIITASGGLPLALKVAGGLLYKREEREHVEEWQVCRVLLLSAASRSLMQPHAWSSAEHRAENTLARDTGESCCV